MKSIYSVILALSLVAVCCCGRETSQKVKPPSPHITDEEKLAINLIEHLEKNSFQNAVKLFHFPAHYTQAKLSEDKSHVVENLETLKGEFGEITQVKPLKGPVAYYKVGIAGADVPYWQQHQTYNQYQYSVHFAKQGDGYLVVEVCKISKTPEVRFLYYAIPVWQPLAKERVTMILGKLMAKRGG